MGLIGTVAVGVLALLGACGSRLLADEFKAWVPSVVDRIISFAVRRAPQHLRERLAEEWRGHVNDTPGDLGKLVVASGFIWASGKLRNQAEHAGIERDHYIRELDVSAGRLRWEHIQRVFEMCDRNVSETARRLKIHRRTLQRILRRARL
jgi:DNA-binding NtrC family response regulator